MARKVRREVPREIADCGGRKARRGGLNPGGRRNANPNSPLPRLRAAFTLTELLVVIAIIAILTALIVPAVMRARIATQEAAVVFDANEMANAFENVKDTYGSYPPNGMNPDDGSTNLRNKDISTIVKSDFERWFKKAFPRHNEPLGLIHALAGELTPGAGNPVFFDLTKNTAASGGMRANEAVYFWLGGFSSDPQYPISGPGGPSFDSSDTEVIESRNRIYPFDLTRLGPRDSTTKLFSGRYITYTDPRNSSVTRRINLWTYKSANGDGNYAYFATNHKPVDYDLDLSGDLGARVYAPIKLREGITAATDESDYVFVSPDKYQILHPGLDNTWGEDFQYFDIRNFSSGLLTYPEGPFTGEIADTLSNFSGGRFDKAQE